ncbi:MAG: hypothetical protein AAF619_03660 [Pseudomonadota bacterium]
MTRIIGGACLNATGWIFLVAGVLYLAAVIVMPLHGMERTIEPVIGGALGIAGGMVMLMIARRISAVGATE